MVRAAVAPFVCIAQKVLTITILALADFLHDVAYDFYGKRLATSSSDQKIRVWDTDASGEWVPGGELKFHSGSVNKLSWAPPEFGQVLASCSSDRTVNVYEERVNTHSSTRTWKNQARLSDSRDAVPYIAFAPRHHGLRLASCSLDGHVRIYEATDAMNLATWNLVEEFEAAKKDCWCISWNPSPFDGSMMAVGSETSARIWEFQPKVSKWQVVLELEGHTDTVHDVAWAPNMGRTYHLVATGCKDMFVRIFKIKLAGTRSGKYEAELVAKLGHHKAEVWRVAWNITGTMLASTGDDGAARLWKSDFRGQWHSTLVASGQPTGAAAAAGAAAPAAPGDEAKAGSDARGEFKDEPAAPSARTEL